MDLNIGIGILEREKAQIESDLSDLHKVKEGSQFRFIMENSEGGVVNIYDSSISGDVIEYLEEHLKSKIDEIQTSITTLQINEDINK